MSEPVERDNLVLRHLPETRAELTGRLGHFETVIGHKFDALAERVAALERQPG